MAEAFFWQGQVITGDAYSGKLDNNFAYRGEA
jgi:hypothetical protein